MTCEEFLMQPRHKLDDVLDIDSQIKILEQRLQSTTTSYDKVRVRATVDRGETEAALGDLSREKQAALEALDASRAEVKKFISHVSVDTKDRGKRYRRLLRLYYVDCLSWNEIKPLLRPISTRTDGRQATYRKGKGVSSASVFRLRLEALAEADITYRQLGMK